MTDLLSLKGTFLRDGYCVLRNALAPEEVETLLSQTEKALSSKENEEDFLRINDSQHIHKIRYMFEKGEFFLKLLVHDAILKIISELSDDITRIVPTWEDMLIKIPKHGIPVTIHQDLALQSAKYDVFSVGIYMHDSYDNPVYYLPGSYKMGPLTKTEIYEVYEKNKGKFVPIMAKAGDIVIHNVKTVHYSEKNESPNPRYTWYLEFRTIDQLQKDSPWDQEWINARRAIWIYALKKYRSDVSHLIPDEVSLKEYIEDLKLRVSHTNEYVDYDMKSPYNHFA
ncbi:MAG: hypothetical protein HON43_04335 [Alphaproteobacteria bacterium]|jgi:phytanoyl-CoA hydroxylase|nr:hypothetical protein [Alphaproteobacteria bacterium]MBT5390323.1 hypothetical protein [Alphaproteobacteria bacterium]